MHSCFLRHFMLVKVIDCLKNMIDFYLNYFKKCLRTRAFTSSQLTCFKIEVKYYFYIESVKTIILEPLENI